METTPEQGRPEDPPQFLTATAFGTLGLLVGTLVSFSAQSLAQAVLAALFAFFGGTVLQVSAIKGRAVQTLVAGATLAISLGTLLGTYSGIYVTEHQLLSPSAKATGSSVPADLGTRKYLRSEDIDSALAVDQQKRTGALTEAEAYAKLLSIITTK